MNLALRSIGDIARHQRLEDSDSASLTPNAMLAELLSDNQAPDQCKRSFRLLPRFCQRLNGILTHASSDQQHSNGCNNARRAGNNERVVVAPIHTADKSSQVSDGGSTGLVRSDHPPKHQSNILPSENFCRQRDSWWHGCDPIKAIKYDRQTVRRGIECLR